MIGLEDAILVWAEFLELGLEQLGFLICNGFFIQNQDVRDVIGMNLGNC